MRHCSGRGSKINFFLTLWVCLLAALALGPPAAADSPAAPQTTGPIIADAAAPTPLGELVVQPYLSLGFVTGNFTASWRRVSAGGNFVSLAVPLKVAYGVARDTEIFVQAAFIQNWAGSVHEPGLRGNRSAGFSGIGDILLALKYQVLAETPRLPTVTALFSVVFPTGHHFRLNPRRLGTDALGTGAFGLIPGVNLSKWLGPTLWYANLWYTFPLRDPGVPLRQQTGPLVPSFHGRDVLTFNLAVEAPLNPRWVALLEFYSTWDVRPLFRASHEPRSALLGLLPGLEYIFSHRWSGALGVALDLGGKNSFYSVTPIITVLTKY